MPQTNVTIPWEAEMRRLDPDLARESRIQVEFKFTGKTFEGETATRGPYEEA